MQHIGLLRKIVNNRTDDEVDDHIATQTQQHSSQGGTAKSAPQYVATDDTGRLSWGGITKGNPNIDFFKKVYYRYYNFATQSFSIPCKGRNHLEFNEETTYVCTLGNRADLLGKMYLNIDLPKVITNDKIKLTYINNIGLGIIKNIDFKLKGRVISSLNGQKIYILNKLLQKKSVLDVGNKQLSIPLSGMKYSSNENSRLYNAPIDTSNERLVIPLPFGFSKHTTLYFPTFLYKTDDITIHITLRPLNEIYTVETFDKDYWYYAQQEDVSGYTIPSSSTQFRKDAISNTDMSHIADYPSFAFGEQPRYKNTTNGNGSPYYLQRYESRTVSIPDITKDEHNIKYSLYDCCTSSYPTQSTYNYNISCSIEADFIFLDTELKQKMYNIFSYSYLFEHCVEDTRNVHKIYSGKQSIDININNPIASLLIGIQRSDHAARNEWLSFSNYEDATLDEDTIIQYQDYWWHSSIGISKTMVSGIVDISGSTDTFSLVPDSFQEFILRYGPYGESKTTNDPSGIGAGFSNWPNAIQSNERLYTIEDIHTFRKIWRYRNASDIPEISSATLQTTWKESPLDNMEIVFHNNVREDVKPNIYYNTLQPYQYSKNPLDSGLFLYSFNLDMSDIQPHGSYHLSPVLQFIMNMELNNPQAYDGTSNGFTITPYALCYNIIEMKQDTFSLLYYNY